MVRALEDAALDLEPEGACELWLGATAGVAVLAFSVAPGVAPVAVVACLVAGPVTLRIARGRARQRYAAAMPGALEQVAAMLRGGATVPEALESLAAGSGPLGPDLRRVLARSELGVGLTDALGSWIRERDLPAVRAAAGALAVAVTVGGRSADAIDGLAASLREHLGAVAEARALSAQARLSGVVVGAVPIAYLAFSVIVDPASASLLVGSAAGRVCLGLGLALDALGILWMRRLVRSGAVA
jgi:tight adherence protein B